TWTVGDNNAVRLVCEYTSITELEGDWLNALVDLLLVYMGRVKEWESGFAELQMMLVFSQRNKGILKVRVVILSQLVLRLAGKVDRVSRFFLSYNS
ncbi:MbeD/MobD family mobilization/exclusion protein, partial [Salmonella enterica]|uniref:MbeD/MobD family mobilization/exclusion protein n=1 Tax=Salmonella enterica TaxID=28901 RepID=UPI003F4B3280